MAEVGRLLALLHDGGLIHGDLTTSNMLVREVGARTIQRLLGPWLREMLLAAPRIEGGTSMGLGMKPNMGLRRRRSYGATKPSQPMHHASSRARVTVRPPV